ncbi:MAG: glycosyltransferase family 9 protein [Burkholderiaceae bacterium]
MSESLVPRELLAKADKILFVAHLALGDFTYLQNCFQAFARAFPHIRIHLWVDETRRTRDAGQWEHLRKYSLYDWVDDCALFDKVYKETYSPQLLARSITEAQRERYPIVISLAVLKRHFYAALIRRISPEGFVAGQKKRVRAWDIPKHLIYRRLDASIPAYVPRSAGLAHISAIYAGWFRTLFGLEMTAEERFPFVRIPAQWHDWAQRRLVEWGYAAGDKVLFLNAFSKSPERSWPLQRMIELAAAIRRQPGWEDACFVVNVVPEKMAEARRLFAACALPRIELFSAEENFFQLPAILSLCTLIVTVETAVMHLANAVRVPVIALMRQTSPEWTPIDAANSHVITVARRKGWVEEITVEQVVAALPAAPAADNRKGDRA